jgi:formylmethanofuran dehydrogenase subunit B
MSDLITNVACAACGLVCEDITVRIEHGKIVAAENACPLCTEKLIGQSANGSGVENFDTAIECAAEILSASKSPLIYGLSGSDIATQRVAVALADHLGATIDPALPPHHRAAIEAFQSVGISTCTLGEVKHRADLVVFWGCDPDDSHPELYKRFLEPAGEFVSKRWIIAIGSQRPTAHVDEFYEVSVEDQHTFISTLRAIVAGREINSADKQLHALAEHLKAASYSAMFFGAEMNGVPELEALFQLVRQLNASTRSVVMGLGGVQIENVLTWQTGYPFAVNFALGYPRYCPHTFSANYLLENEQVDAVVLIGNGGLEHFSASAKKNFEKLPTILLEEASRKSELKPAVGIQTAVPGIQCEGTVFRMDGVPLRLPAIFDSQFPTAADVLSAIQRGVLSSCV